MTQVERIFGLSSLLAIGFVLIVFSGALYGNWSPLIVVALFLVAPLPNALCGHRSTEDFLSETPDLLADFGRFFTGFLLLSGTALPITLAHNGIIQYPAMLMSLFGGGIVYGTIISFGMMFSEPDEF